MCARSCTRLTHMCRYALLKSNQVDEASMTDLSRLVFKIIPYDKSEVIQMMYKLLYLESQLETGA